MDMATPLKINIDFTFPRMACSLLSLDVMDISGEQHLDVSHTVYKTKLDKEGNIVGDAELHELHGKVSSDPKTHPRRAILDATPFQDGGKPPEKEEEGAKKEKQPWELPGYCGNCYGAAPKKGDIMPQNHE